MNLPARRRAPLSGWAHLLAGAALMLLLLVVPVSPAVAHAALTASRPEAGSQLASTPGVVEISFSETLIADLSTLRVTDPVGEAWERTSVGDQSMAAQLDTTAAGVYVVEWTTVSPIDGHTLSGSFRFGVGVDPGHAESLTTAPTLPGIVVAGARAVEYTGLLLVLGMTLLRRLARREPALPSVRPRLRWGLAAALAGGLTVVAGEALLAARSPSLAAVGRYLSAEPGLPRLVRVGAEAAARAAAFTPRRWAVLPLTGVAVVGLAAAGHAAAAQPAWWGITVDAAHLATAGWWAGGVAALAFVRPAGGWRGDEGRELLARFSPIAVVAFVGTVASGSLRAVQELVGITDLVATSYGRVLLLKLVAVALMVPLSWRAWRRRSPRPRVEGFLAVVAVVAAALLAAYPVPPQRAAEDAALAERDTSGGLPQEGDLALVDTSDDTVVALTFRPGRPGRNEALVYLLPVEGAEAAGGVDVRLSLGGEEQALEACGAACRRGDVAVHGGERVEVTVEGHGDRAVFKIPPLPATDATHLTEEMSETMSALDSVRYEEVFGPADPPVRSTAAMVAPDRMRFETHTNSRVTIRIGERFYRRTADRPWEVEDGLPLEVPQYIWDYPKAAARVVGEEKVGGTRTTVVTFFVEAAGLPVWYRLWIDSEGLVHKAQMRTQGHFMDHRYFDFDEPITIRPPV